MDDIKAKEAQKTDNDKVKIIPSILIISALLFLGFILFKGIFMPTPTPDNVLAFREKAELLKPQVLSEEVLSKLPKDPAGDRARYAIFISVCDGNARADVFTGTGETAQKAWENANSKAEDWLREKGTLPRWVKADILCQCKTVSAKELKRQIISARHDFYRKGVSFTPSFSTALLEAELNGAKIYDYDKGVINLKYLNTYLKKAGRKIIKQLPKRYRLFTCSGWLCDEDKTVYQLIDSGLDYGRRKIKLIDKSYCQYLLEHATTFLLKQVKEDGSFIYGIYPRFDNDIPGYNIVRHISTIWSLIIRYRMEPSPELQKTIENTLDHVINNYIVYKDDKKTAYVVEKKANEIKLGGLGVAVITMTEYMDVFKNDKYKDVCCALGNGILSMMDQNQGTYVHVFNTNYSLKQRARTVYYDGEATFALCRLYALTNDKKWLTPACKAADHFIKANYAQYKDHWVAYAMNELTKHVNRPEYYAFALKNAQDNLKNIAERDTTWHTYLELLMVTFETYDRMMEKKIDTGKFDIKDLLKTIYIRADRQLNGFFYPEYAMYMKNPNRILYTFMVRHDGSRVRIDDIQHNIDGYYLYWKNFDKMNKYGLTEIAKTACDTVEPDKEYSSEKEEAED